VNSAVRPVCKTVLALFQQIASVDTSDVNKDLTFKAKDKDQTLKAKDQDKD